MYASYSVGSTYKVVAFMVKVKLVENNVNRKVGIVNVLNATTRYKIPGKKATKESSRCPSTDTIDPSRSCVGTLLANTAAVFIAFTISVPVDDVISGDSECMIAEVSAMVLDQPSDMLVVMGESRPN